MREAEKLVQLGGFGFGGDEDENVRVGVFPEGEEILIGGAGFGTRCLRVSHLSQLRLNRVSAGETEMRERVNGFVRDDSTMGRGLSGTQQRLRCPDARPDRFLRAQKLGTRRSNRKCCLSSDLAHTAWRL